MVEGRAIPFCCLYGDTEHSDRGTLLSVSLTRQAGLSPLGEYLAGFVEHGFDGFQLCAGLVNLHLSDGKLRLRGHRLLHRVYFALLQLVFRILDLCDR